MKLVDSRLERIDLRRMNDAGGKTGFARFSVEVDCDPLVYGEQGFGRQRSICIDNIASTLGYVVDGRIEMLRLSFGELIGHLLTPRVYRPETVCSQVSTLDGSACCKLPHLVLLEGRVFLLRAKQRSAASFMPIVTPKGANHRSSLSRKGADETVQSLTKSKHGVRVLREHWKLRAGAPRRHTQYPRDPRNRLNSPGSCPARAVLDQTRNPPVPPPQRS